MLFLFLFYVLLISLVMKFLYQDFNVSSKDLNDFFGGPAFLAWARMGNLHGYVKDNSRIAGTCYFTVMCTSYFS